MSISKRRIYIVPTRFGLSLALLLIAMLIAGLNYNSNLGLAFAFLMVSLALVAMHHCHRNLLGLGIDATLHADAFAGATANLEFILHNMAAAQRCDLMVRCPDGSKAIANAPAKQYQRLRVVVPALQRGTTVFEQFELQTRYPFGWFRAWTYVHTALTLYVAPAPRGDRLLPSTAAPSGDSARFESRGDEDFAGLRAYAAGMPLKHMAWKVLARGGDPAVRSYSGSAAHPRWLDWSTLGHLDTESRLCQLCQWVLASDATGQAYGLRLPQLEIQPSRGSDHRALCLRALAIYPGLPTA